MRIFGVFHSSEEPSVQQNQRCYRQRREPAEENLFCVFIHIGCAFFLCQRNKRTMVLNKKQTVMPHTVGTRKDTAVHRRLWVSLRMVSTVVAQGQCIRENRIVLTAVVHVQPF